MFLGYVIYYLLFLLLFISIFVIVYLFAGNKKGLLAISPNIQENQERVFIFKNAKYVKYLDRLIVKSNLRKYVHWLNTDILLLLSTIFGILGFWISYVYLNNILTSIAIFVALFSILTFIIQWVISYNNSKIEKSFLYFLNILCNFAQLKDDLYFSFEKSIQYMNQPLKSYCKTFVEEVKRGLPLEEALENFKEKIDNERFKLFIKNAQLCAKHGGSFLRLASNTLELVKQLQIEKSRRKNETALGRTLIFVMAAINIGLAVYMFTIYPDTMQRIRTDFYGQLVIFLNTVNLFIIFYLSLKLDKMDY